jgi:deazaflavin-dependent oxidoreductase (nitroreductase family)
MNRAWSDLERAFFGSINAFVEPIVRTGFGSPCRWPVGAVVIEVTGRKSGRLITVPLMAMVVGDRLIISTARGRQSQWVRNLAAKPEVRYWMGGKPHNAHAFVFREPGELPDGFEKEPPPIRQIASLLPPLMHQTGLAFAILAPQEVFAGAAR